MLWWELQLVEWHMSDHKFELGQALSYVSGFRGRGSRRDHFKIMQCLPPQGGDYQYRIRGAAEAHESCQGR